MSTALRFAAVALTLGAGGAAALADDLLVPSHFRRIEDAGAVARPGDRIVVTGRVRADAAIYADGVVVDLTRARIDGRLTIDGADATVLGGDLRRGVFVHGDHATIRGARVRGSAQPEYVGVRCRWLSTARSVVVWVLGPDATLDGLKIRATSSETAVASSADRLVVRGCDVRGGAAGADVEGAAPVISGNRFTGQKAFAVGAAADDAVIRGNFVGALRHGVAVFVEGARGDVEHNTVRDCEFGTRCHGDGTVVRDNEFTTTWFAAIQVWSGSGTHAVTGNRIRAASGVGIDSRGVGAVVADNQIRSTGRNQSIFVAGGAAEVRHNFVQKTSMRTARWTASDGIEVHGDGHVVAGNSIVERQGDDSRGVFVDGVGNTVSDNDVRGGGTGITVCGCSNAIDANTVGGVSLDGIVVAGEFSTVTAAVVDDAGGVGILLFTSVDVTGGSVSHCSMAGIVAIGDGCSLAGCTLSHNGRVDVVIDGVGGVATSGLAPNVRIVTDPANVPRLIDRIDQGPARVGMAPVGLD